MSKTGETKKIASVVCSVLWLIAGFGAIIVAYNVLRILIRLWAINIDGYIYGTPIMLGLFCAERVGFFCVECFLVWSSVVCFAACTKGGIKKLKHRSGLLRGVKIKIPAPKFIKIDTEISGASYPGIATMFIMLLTMRPIAAVFAATITTASLGFALILLLELKAEFR